MCVCVCVFDWEYMQSLALLLHFGRDKLDIIDLCANFHRFCYCSPCTANSDASVIACWRVARWGGCCCNHLGQWSGQCCAGIEYMRHGHGAIGHGQSRCEEQLGRLQSLRPRDSRCGRDNELWWLMCGCCLLYGTDRCCTRCRRWLYQCGQHVE